MRSCLDPDGKLLPPKSLEIALSRRRRLEDEARRIFADVEFGAPHGSPEEHEAWRTSALVAMTKFRLEAHLLTQWIDAQTRDLILSARNLFTKLIDDGVEFEDHEFEVIKKLDAYLQVFSSTVERHQQTEQL